MFIHAIHGETLVKDFICNGINLQLVSAPATIWCGSLSYAPDCDNEPDIGALLQRYQECCNVEKQQLANPDWSCAISIDYWQEGKVPRGMMFAQQVLTEQQSVPHDVYRMPQTLFFRTTNSPEHAKAAFGKDSCELFELFGFIKDNMNAFGYTHNPNGSQEIELYNHGAGQFYAYVPVIEA